MQAIPGHWRSLQATRKRILTRGKVVDANGDALVCVTQFAPAQGQDKQWGFPGYVITKIIDNNAQGH